MAKRYISKADLEGLALSELRSTEGCEDIRGLEIEHVDDVRIDANWRIATIERTAVSVAQASEAELRNTARAIEDVQDKLRAFYGLRILS